MESLLGHQFRDPRLLHQALMHSSRIPERADQEPAESNEKLEFSRRRQCSELVVSEELVREFRSGVKDSSPRAALVLVNATAISLSAQRLGLWKYLRLWAA